MKRYVAILFLSLTTVLGYSQVSNWDRQVDSVDVNLFHIVVGVDSPHVEIYLSPHESYVVESHFCEEDEKMVLPTKIAADLFSMMYGFFVSKEPDIKEKSDSHNTEDTIPFDLIQVPLIHNVGEPVKLLFVSNNRHLEGKAFSRPYIQLINRIQDVARDYRSQLVSHAGEIDTEDPVLQVNVPEVGKETKEHPFYCVNIICKFDSLGKDSYDILLTPQKGIIQDARKKFFYKSLSENVRDWLYGKIQKYVLSVNKIQKLFSDDELMDLGAQPFTLVLWDDSEKIIVPSTKKGVVRDCYIMTDKEAEARIALNKTRLMSPQDIKIVQEICRQYRKASHK